MKDLRDYDISFSGLGLGEHDYEFELKTAFFEYFGFNEYENFDLFARVKMNKSNTMLEFFGSIGGHIEVPCDLSNELFDLPISKEFEVVVKFGEEYNDEDEIIVLPFSEHKWNIGHLLYEYVVLSIPAKKVHPGILDGSIELDYELEEEEIEEEEVIDPRWAKLQELKKGNND